MSAIRAATQLPSAAAAARSVRVSSARQSLGEFPWAVNHRSSHSGAQSGLLAATCRHLQSASLGLPQIRSPAQQKSGRMSVAAAEATASPLRVVLVSAVAMIDSNGRILLAQRPEGKAMAGLWEFPGGKVEPNETPEAALARELSEELQVSAKASSFQPLTFASHTYENFHLLMPLFVCTEWSGEPVGAEGQQLAWVLPGELEDYSMPAADVPLIEPARQAALAIASQQ